MKARENLKIKEKEKCIYLGKYLEVLKNKNMVQYIHPGTIEAIVFLDEYLLGYGIILFTLLRLTFLVSSHVCFSFTR